MKRQLFLFAILVILHGSALSQDFQPKLEVLNPQQDWIRVQGTIEEASFTIEPRGTYAEIGMYLTFSARGTFFDESEQLEVVLDFELPEGAVITDSWLWVGDEIVQALHFDRWTASGIYEGIVNRRRDPSLLTKEAPGKYELRVYPLLASESRRVKITYLVPLEWTASSVYVPLATNVISLSQNPVSELTVLNLDPETWNGFGIAEAGSLPIERFIDEDGHPYESIDLTGIDQFVQRAKFDAPTDDGIYLDTFEANNEHWYQLALVPGASLELDEQRNVALVFDYDASHTRLPVSDMLDVARQKIKAQFAETDSLNVFFATLDIESLSDRWVPAHPDTIDVLFEALATKDLATFSNLPIVLTEAISFVEQMGNNGDVVLVSSSSNMSDLDNANAYIKDLQAQWPLLPAIHVVDFATESLSETYTDIESFLGNGYLYTNLTRLTAGQFSHARNRGLDIAMAEVLRALGPAFRTFDLHTTLEGGFTFNRFTSSDAAGSFQANGGVLQVGQFIGDFPFTVEFSGVRADEPFSLEYVIDEARAAQGDSTLRTLWTGRQIDFLESKVQTNSIIAEVINYSLQERVLSSYTAFLALEPGILDQQPCDVCRDESDGGIAIPNVEDPATSSSLRVEAYPNPFTDRVRVSIETTTVTEPGAVSILIYNTLGQVVARLELDSGGPGQQFEVIWDGVSSAGEVVTSGIYFVVVNTPQGRQTMKLVLIR